MEIIIQYLGKLIKIKFEVYPRRLSMTYDFQWRTAEFTYINDFKKV